MRERGRKGGRGRWGKREREEEKITKLVLSNRCNTKIQCTGIKPARLLQVLGVLECANTLIWNALMSHRSRVRFLIPLPTFLSRNFTSQKQIFKKKKHPGEFLKDLWSIILQCQNFSGNARVPKLIYQVHTVPICKCVAGTASREVSVLTGLSAVVAGGDNSRSYSCVWGF